LQTLEMETKLKYCAEENSMRAILLT
jgi:hypothetical protein